MNSWLKSEFASVDSRSKSSNDNWCEKYAPKRKCDLAVHKKKVETVSSVLTEALATRKNRVIILSGPPGCGKSATIRALSKDLGYDIEEWITPVQKYEKGIQYESEKMKFQNFLMSSSRYPSLFSNSEITNDNNIKKIVLVEDMPTFVSQYPEELWQIVQEYSKFGKFPIVIIISDSTQGYRVPHQYLNIPFNPIANTFLTKTLNAIAESEKVNADIASIVEIADGDLRNALLVLQFSSSKGGGRISSKRKKKSVKSVKPTGVHSKDKSLFILHAIAKILYAKRDDSGSLDSLDYPDLARKPLECCPEEVSESCTLSSDMLAQFLHQNYLGFYDNIDNLLIPTEFFCDSDIFTTGFVDKEFNSQMEKYSSSVATRAIMFSHDSSVSTKFTPICKPIQKETNETCRKNIELCREQFALEHSGSNKSFLVDTLPFLRKLRFKPRNSEQYKLISNLSTYDQRTKFSQTLGQKEPIFCDSQDENVSSTQSKEDLYLSQCKDLEDEIEEFSD